MTASRAKGPSCVVLTQQDRGRWAAGDGLTSTHEGEGQGHRGSRGRRESVLASAPFQEEVLPLVPVLRPLC